MPTLRPWFSPGPFSLGRRRNTLASPGFAPVRWYSQITKQSQITCRLTGPYFPINYLSRHLIVEGESPAEFAALLAELGADYQPVGVVETGLVEQVAIVLWRKARLVRAEAAMVNLNRRTFGGW